MVINNMQLLIISVPLIMFGAFIGSEWFKPRIFETKHIRFKLFQE